MGRVPLLFGLAATLLVSALVPSAASAAPASFDGQCESPSATGSLSLTQLGSYDHAGIQSPDRLVAVQTPDLMGKCSIQIQVQPGDLDTSGTDRDEITGTGTLWRNGDNVWYVLGFMLGTTNPLPPQGEWMLIHQFFAQDIANHDLSGGSPPFAIEVTPSGYLTADVRGGVKASAYAADSRSSEYKIAPATAGVWHTLLIHIQWSTGSNGVVQIWHRQGNGAFTTTPQVSASGPNVFTVAGDVLPVYAETGIYRSHTSTTQTVYYAGLMAAPTAAGALAPWSVSGPAHDAAYHAGLPRRRHPQRPRRPRRQQPRPQQTRRPRPSQDGPKPDFRAGR